MGLSHSDHAKQRRTKAVSSVAPSEFLLAERNSPLVKDALKTLLQNRPDLASGEQATLASLMAGDETIDHQGVRRLLDLGCGDGGAYDRLSKLFPSLDYHGLDIAESPEVMRRIREDLAFYEFDGVNIPFDSDTFDAIHCQQVLEHVRYPDSLVAETSRVLKPGAWFMGSVSQLEPYHSRSIFNWTAYGILQVFESHGFEVKRLAPGIDGVTLTLRRLFGPDKFRAFFSVESLFNHFIDHQYRISDKNRAERSFLKLSCAGHIVFIAQKTPV